MLFMFLIFTLAFSNVFADPPIHLSFNELQNISTEKNKNMWDFQSVTIRGFLYQSVNGLYFLSAESGLKSCCVGSSQKLSQQIRVEFDSPIASPLSKQPITLKGTFIFNPNANDNEDGSYKYTLKMAHIQSERNFSLYWIPLLFLACFLGIFLMRKRRRGLCDTQNR